MRDIEQVLTDYATGIDTQDWALFRSCFVEDCEMVTAAGAIAGADALTEHMRLLHAGLDGSAHRLSNLSVRREGDAASATSYLDALLVDADHVGGPTFHVIGTYTDDLVQDATGWLIARRTFTALWREGNPAVLITQQSS